MSPRHSARALIADCLLVLASVTIAYALAETNLLVQLLTDSARLGYAGSFLAGIFFTSIFTLAPAAATLGELARTDGVVTVALFGAAGAVVGDLLIFRFVKDRFSDHLASYLEHWHGFARAKEIVARPSLRWLAWSLGGLVIASPLPDELGVALIGASRMSYGWFAVLSFAFNFAGIALVGLAARAI